MKPSLMIFAGAGASRGVSQEKYPMALDFRKRLPSEIRSDRLFSALDSYLNSVGERDTYDIEHVLWELDGLIELLNRCVDEPNFPSFLLSTGHISTITGNNNQGSNTRGQFSQLRHQAIRLAGAINENVYDFYSQDPTEEELSRSWIPLLQWASDGRFEALDIVTTNYDLVIENAVSFINTPIDLGHTEGLRPGINLDKWGSTSNRAGLLTKLHGSVDWKLGNGGTEENPIIRRGQPEFDGDHRKRLILYPGFKGRPRSQPFLNFHEYFRRRLPSFTHLLFIGFAFRDEHINDLIGSWVSPVARIAVVNPADELPKLPFLKNAVHLRRLFGVSEDQPSGQTDVEPLRRADLMSWASQ